MEMVGLLLWLVSGGGLLASVVLHINSYLALFGPDQELATLLVIGIFIVGLPLMGLLRVPPSIGSGFIREMLKRYPRWVQVIVFIGLAYVLLSFTINAVLLDPNDPFVMVRIFSGHSIMFYGLFFMLSSRLMSSEFPYSHRD